MSTNFVPFGSYRDKIYLVFYEHDLSKEKLLTIRMTNTNGMTLDKFVKYHSNDDEIPFGPKAPHSSDPHQFIHGVNGVFIHTIEVDANQFVANATATRGIYTFVDSPVGCSVNNRKNPCEGFKYGVEFTLEWQFFN